MSDENTFDDGSMTNALSSYQPSGNNGYQGYSGAMDTYAGPGGWGGVSSENSFDNGSMSRAVGVVPGASGSSWWDWDGIKKWVTEGTGDDKKGPSILAMVMPSLLSAGMGAVGELLTGAQRKKRALEKQRVAIEQQNANTMGARVAQTSYGNSVPTIKKKLGLIDSFHPVIQHPTGVL